jgi:hypothetical protein
MHKFIFITKNLLRNDFFFVTTDFNLFIDFFLKKNLKIIEFEQKIEFTSGLQIRKK